MGRKVVQLLFSKLTILDNRNGVMGVEEKPLIVLQQNIQNYSKQKAKGIKAHCLNLKPTPKVRI